MIFEQFERLTRDRTVKATIGMSRDKFDALVPAFASSDVTQQNRIDNNEIKYVQKGGSHGVLDTPEKQLCFILYYLKTYPTFDVLGFHFDLSAGHAHDYAVFFLPILQHALERLNVAPERTINSNSDLQQLIDKYDKVVIDGLEVPCVRPADNEAQKDRYSGKKKRHTVKSGLDHRFGH